MSDGTSAKSSITISNTRSHPAACQIHFVWSRSCWIETSSTSALFVKWRGEFGRTPPFDIGPDTLFAGYICWAEMMCFKVLGWDFPTYVYDQHTAYLARQQPIAPV